MNENKNRLQKLLSNDELMFKLLTATKFTLITAMFAFTTIALTYLLLKIDLVFFETHGYPVQFTFQSTFFEFIFRNMWEMLKWLILFTLFIFLGGYYIAVVMMRPFRTIGLHCEERLNNQTRFYQVDFLSDLKLLTSFSSFFFNKVDEAKVKNKLIKVEIPEDFKNIHKPIIEKNFFINYFFLIVIMALLASVGILVLSNEIRSQVIALSTGLMKQNQQVKFFLERQAEVENQAIMGLLIVHIFVNFAFGLHLYNKISTPAFAVFATLRSFLKGNYHNRIHLVGFYYLRNDCRKINKYLDHIQKSLT
jgi:hypothetical protein